MVVLASDPVLALPPAGSFPDQPPEAVQLLAFVEDQVSCAVPPLLTLLGLALRKRLGGVEVAPWDAGIVVAALPEGPELFSVMPPSQAASAAVSAQYSATRASLEPRRSGVAARRITLHPSGGPF